MELNLVCPFSENSSHWKDSFESDKKLVLQYSMAGFLTSKTTERRNKKLLSLTQKKCILQGKLNINN